MATGAHVAEGRAPAATRDIGLMISCGDISGRLAVESSRAGVVGRVPLIAVRSGSGVSAAAGDGAGAGLAVADSGAAAGPAGVATAGGEGSVKEQMVVRVASMTSWRPSTPAAVASACRALSACTTRASALTAWITADRTCTRSYAACVSVDKCTTLRHCKTWIRSPTRNDGAAADQAAESLRRWSSSPPRHCGSMVAMAQMATLESKGERGGCKCVYVSAA